MREPTVWPLEVLVIVDSHDVDGCMPTARILRELGIGMRLAMTPAEALWHLETRDTLVLAVVVVGDPDVPERRALLAHLRECYPLLRRIVLVDGVGEAVRRLDDNLTIESHRVGELLPDAIGLVPRDAPPG